MGCRSGVALAVLTLAVSFPLRAQEAQADDDPHAACAAIGWVPREILERPLAVRAGVGRIHDPATTSSPEAQALYDQGVAYLHSYVWIEAARSFNQALRVDPKLALAHLGLSRVYQGLNDMEAARASYEKAKALAGPLTPHEQRRIAVRDVHLQALADLANRDKHLAYKRALDDALADFMDDTELWLLRANAEEPSAAGRGQRGGAASVAFYDQVLRLDPDNFAAHHYLIHSYETINRIDKALVHGEIYARAAPAIPHAHHMYAHDLRRVGRVEDAIAAFRKAYDLELAYYAAENITPGLDWHHAHNLDLLSTCYQHQGRMRLAAEYMQKSIALPAVQESQEYNRKEWAAFLLARGQSSEALAFAREMSKGEYPGARAVGHAIAGTTLLELGKLDEAKASLAAAERELEEVTRRGLTSYYLSRGSVAPYVDSLKGELLLRTGRKDEGRAILKDVEQRIRAVPGPDAWTQALFRLEAIFKTASDVSDLELMEFTAAQMKEHDPAFGGTQFALGVVAQKRGDAAAAKTAFAEAARLWDKADADLPELQRLRQRVASIH